MKNFTLFVTLAFCISVFFTNCKNTPAEETAEKTSKTDNNQNESSDKTTKDDLPDGCAADFNINAKADQSFFEYGDAPAGNALEFEVFERTLNIERQRFSKLPKEILNATCVETINMTRNFLTKFPMELLKQTDLKKIDLSYNKIKTFPNIKTPSQIVSLNLSGNKIKEIPASIKLFTNLEHLYLEDMESLEKIHDDIQELKKLKHLVIKKTPVGRSYTKSRKLIKLLPNTQVFWFSKRK